MRARRYLDLAEDARRSAAACKEQLRDHYLYLAEQWEKLAADYVQYVKEKSAEKGEESD